MCAPSIQPPSLMLSDGASIAVSAGALPVSLTTTNTVVESTSSTKRAVNELEPDESELKPTALSVASTTITAQNVVESEPKKQKSLRRITIIKES